MTTMVTSLSMSFGVGFSVLSEPSPLSLKSAEVPLGREPIFSMIFSACSWRSLEPAMISKFSSTVGSLTSASVRRLTVRSVWISSLVPSG